MGVSPGCGLIDIGHGALTLPRWAFDDLEQAVERVVRRKLAPDVEALDAAHQVGVALRHGVQVADGTLDPGECVVKVDHSLHVLGLTLTDEVDQVVGW